MYTPTESALQSPHLTVGALFILCSSSYMCVYRLTAGASSGDPPVIAYAAYYFTYSTWEGRVLHLEDIFVLEQHRGEEVVYFS